jgi:hypothetical protein
MLKPKRTLHRQFGRVMDSTKSHDGFRIHKNPDGSYVFIEGGIGPQAKALLTHKESRAINACFERRGLNGKWDRGWAYKHTAVAY